MEKDVMDVFSTDKNEEQKNVKLLIDMEGSTLIAPYETVKAYNKLLINKKDDEENILSKHIEEVSKRGTNEIEFIINGSSSYLLAITSIVPDIESNMFDIIVSDGKEKPVFDAKSMVKNLEKGRDPLEGVEEKSEIVTERHTVRIWSEKYTSKNNQVRTRLKIMDNKGNNFSVSKIQSLIYKADYVTAGVSVAKNEKLEELVKGVSELKAKVLKEVADDAKGVDYINSLADDYKYLAAAGLLWKCGYKVTELITDDLTKEQAKWLAQNAASSKYLMKLDRTRPFELWGVDLVAIEYKVDYEKVYDITDSAKDAEDKLVKYINERDNMIYANTYTTNNTAIRHIDKPIKISKDTMHFIDTGKLKISDYLYMQDYLGIYSLEDKPNYSIYKDILFVKVKGIDMLYRYVETEEGITIGGVPQNDMEIEGYYIEILPISKRHEETLKEFFKDNDLEFKEKVNVIELSDKTLEDWKQLFEIGTFNYQDERSKVLDKLKDSNSTVLDIHASSEAMQYFCAMFNDAKLDILFYDKDYGFRRIETRLNSSLGKSGFRSKVMFSEIVIPSNKFVRVEVDVNAGIYRANTSNINDLLRQMK